MKYLSIGLRGFLTIAFVVAGGAKLAGVDMMVQTFEAVGIGQWFRYVTALIEIGGAILLWIPALRVKGAALLAVTMVGAVLTHLLILGPSAVPALILGTIAGAIVYLHRAEIWSGQPS